MWWGERFFFHWKGGDQPSLCHKRKAGTLSKETDASEDHSPWTCQSLMVHSSVFNPSCWCLQEKTHEGPRHAIFLSPTLAAEVDNCWDCTPISLPSCYFLPAKLHSSRHRANTFAKLYLKAGGSPSNTSVQMKPQRPHQLSAASLGTVTNLRIHLHKLYKNECIKLYLSVLVSCLIWVDVACPPTEKTYNTVSL